MPNNTHLRSPEPRIRRRALVLRPALALACAVAALTAFVFSAHAANPPAGTIDANTTTPITWIGTAPGGASAGEDTCIDGVNCDVFTLTVNGAPADYAGKLIALTFEWTVPANDYDFYIHKDSLDGPVVGSGNNVGAPETADNAAIDPSATGTGVYVIHIVYFSVVGVDQYRGTAAVATKSTADRTATYESSGIQFSPNVTVKAPVAGRDGEPSIRTDYKGNMYTGGIRGVPAGVDLWYVNLDPASAGFDPGMRVPAYRGQPDGFTEKTEADVGGDGGGDIDLAVGFPPLSPADVERDPPYLAYSSLTLANISSGRTRDRAVTFELNPLGNLTGGPPGDDRQWHEFYGSNSVYLLYRTVAPAIANVQRSNDGGFTYGVTAPVGLIGQVGCLDVHQKTGTVYASGSLGVVAVGTPASPGQAPAASDYVIRQAASDPNGVANIFFVAKVADDETADGTLYVVYSNGQHIYLKSSTDKGATWSDRVRVNPPSGPFATNTNLFPWMETGPTQGSVGIVWYGTANPTNDDNAQWKVYYAQSFNAHTATPSFRVAEVTEPEHVIHGSNISTGGLTGTANRNLIDYFQISFDPQGAAVVAYTDDHNDYDGHTYIARQLTGPSIKGGNLPAQVEGAGLSLPAATTNVELEDVFPPRQPGLNGEQVTDFRQDAQSALLARAKVNDPYDLAWARYDTSGTGASLAIGVTMKVTELSPVPPSSQWRASFAVNAPNSVLSADGTYTYGVADDADQFFLMAETNASGGFVYRYGTAVRNSDGTITYTNVGDADTGQFNTGDDTISLQVSVAKLNEVLAAAGRPLIGNGTVVTGLRARSQTTVSGNGRRDLTRGGTQFVVYDSAFARPAPAPSATPLPPRATAPGATPAPTPPEIELANISSRVAVGAGDDIGIAGFIVRSNGPKRLMIRGIGPSLKVGNDPVAGRLADPSLEIRRTSNNQVVATNDNWRGSAQEAAITASGLAPTEDGESAVIVNLTAGAYTAVLRGAGEGTGIGLVEVYDIDAGSFADLGNISTRATVGTGNSVLIGGVIVRDDSSQNRPQDVLFRGIGPSLSEAGVTNPLQDPELVLVDLQGTTLATNDDWGSAAGVGESGIPPTNPKESAIRRTLAPGGYTVILRGVGGGTGTGLVEAYNLGNQ